MTNNYLLKKVWLTIGLVLSTLFTIAQNINFDFENVNDTFDGTDWWYNADIFISTTGGQADFKLGSGQIYFNYNTAAFGENVYDVNNQSTDNFDFLQPDNSIVSEKFLGVIDIYGPFVSNNNTSSRVSVSFLQVFGSGTIAANNVTNTPAHLFSIRFRYIDINESPNVAIEDNNAVLSQATDQFSTACGPNGAGAPANCTSEPGSQFIGATFDSSNATDTAAPVITLTGDNPQEINVGENYTELGATTDDGGSIIGINSNQIDINTPGDYNVLYNATDIAGNNAIEVTRVVTVTGVVLDINDLNTSINEITVSPNPAIDFIKIKSTASIEKIELIDLSGHLISFVKNYKNNEEINISKLSSGVYLVRISSENGTEVQKLIKK